MQTRNQKLAVDVFSKVSEFRRRFTDENDKVKKEHEAAVKLYGSIAHKLPVLIRQAGLAQALAFVSARGKGTQIDLLTHLSQTVNLPGGELVTRSRQAKLGEYVHLTRETLAALAWYKRFAQSVLEVESGEDISADVLDGEAIGG